MTASADAATAVRAALAQFIDYAGLFPPARLEMDAALAAYAAAQSGPLAWMLGRFIVPASRIGELLAALETEQPAALSVIADAGNDPRTWLVNLQTLFEQLADLRAREPRVRIEALEAPLPPLATQRESYDATVGQLAAARKRAAMNDVPAFVEIPRDGRWEDELDGALFALARHRLGGKLRCGGIAAQAFPSSREVAKFIAGAAGEYGIPWKATAGLHHPVYHRDEDLGVMRHGFLNLLSAAAAARSGASSEEVQHLLECEDASRIAPGAPGLSAEELRAVRQSGFIAYGSCSFDEPTTDLQALGIL